MCILLAHEIFAVEVMQCILSILNYQVNFKNGDLKPKAYSGVFKLNKPKTCPVSE